MARKLKYKKEEGMEAKRISEYDVIITGRNPRPFIDALKQAGLKVKKLTNTRYQVSFDGCDELRRELPEIGKEYKI